MSSSLLVLERVSCRLCSPFSDWTVLLGATDEQWISPDKTALRTNS